MSAAAPRVTPDDSKVEVSGLYKHLCQTRPASAEAGATTEGLEPETHGVCVGSHSPCGMQYGDGPGLPSQRVRL